MASRHHVLVIGAGWIGRRHVEALLRTGRANVAICEVDSKRANALATEFGITQVFASSEEALRKDWNGAVVATPAPTHPSFGLQLAQLGIPALVEKPVAVTNDNLREWQDAVTARSVSVLVGYVFRSHPVLRALRAEISAGRIGRPLQAIAQRGANLAARRPDYAQTYYARADWGGGVVHDILSHVYNAAEWLVGPIERVCADATHASLAGVDVDDTVHALARHGSVLGSYAVNQFQPAAEFALTINGTHGSLRGLFHEDAWEEADVPDAGWKRTTLPKMSTAEWFRQQADHFLDMIEQRCAPVCSLADGVQTLQAILATCKAARQHKRWIEVSPHAIRTA